MDYFKGLFGNHLAKKVLSRLVERGDVWRTYIFAGLDGVGKFLFAERFALASLCLEDTKPCGRCKVCLSYKKGINPYIKVVEPQGDSITVSQIRDVINFVSVSSSMGRFVLVRDAHLMTQGASNAFLKTLEEVPEKSAFILISPSPYHLLPTVRSRAFVVSFKALKASEVMEFIKNKGYTVDKEEFEVLYYLSGGSLGTFLELLEGGVYQVVERLYYGMEEQDEEMVAMALTHGSAKRMLEALVSYMMAKGRALEEVERVVKAMEYLERRVRPERVARFLALGGGF